MQSDGPVIEGRPFPIVGVGASAGGVEALEGFFRGMPEDPGLALVIITHLSPDRESILHEIIARYTKLAVAVAVDGAEVESNCVYVLPSDAIITIRNRRLVVKKQDGSRRERKPIDIFFSALAIDLGEYAAGVVLSGGDGDGTLGAKAIKERGGLTLAQTADDYGPGHSDMPQGAIAAGVIDLAVPAERMGHKLEEFARGQRALEEMSGNPVLSDDGDTSDHARGEIYAILRSQIGHDFAGYKIKTFLRRVQRRMQVVQINTIQAYVERLRQDATEASALFRDLLINVTNFFRDGEAFENLAELVIPKLFEGRTTTDTVRVWVPGCATGEEVYSVGILLREHMDGLAAPPRVQIFATDIDEHALGVARSARYPEALLDSVSPERRKRFFVEDGGSSVIAKEVRDLCIFSPHSVIRDPPFSRMDLVSCRNLLIYFGADAQSQVVPTFHHSLRSNGYLFLGTSENVSQFRDLFTAIDKKHRIFRKRDDVTASISLPLMVRNMGPPGQIGEMRPRKLGAGAMAMRQSVQAQVLERFSPPHVVVNREGDVVFYSSRTGKYLEAAPGIPTRQLLILARRGLRLDLRTLFREAMERNQTAVREGVAVETDDGRVQLVTLTVDPVADGLDEPLYLVLFSDEGGMLSREEAASRSVTMRDGASFQIEQELRDTRERLQSLVEEYETALEELKSSNEELQSVNEEFQSTNEELEASKEELQSVNEELHTVNAELTGKVDALDRTNNDLQNLFDSTNIATIFLDRALVIQNFTPAMSQVFNILPGDRGRPLTDLSSRMQLPDLRDDVAAILAGSDLIERRINPEDGSAHYLMRVTPYRGEDHATAGVVVTFVDVTGLTRAEARLRVMVAELQHRTRNLLGVVQAIARQTIGKGGSLDDFKERLSALGRVQGLISHATGNSVELGEILTLELKAHGAGDGEHVHLSGPRVDLRLEDVQAVALVLHELATNAVKYGALKAGDAAEQRARLSVTWKVEQRRDSSTLLLDWVETGVAVPAGANRIGFGRRLIEDSLTSALKAKTTFVLGPGGVSCSIELPLDYCAGDHHIPSAAGG